MSETALTIRNPSGGSVARRSDGSSGEHSMLDRALDFTLDWAPEVVDLVTDLLPRKTIARRVGIALGKRAWRSIVARLEADRKKVPPASEVARMLPVEDGIPVLPPADMQSAEVQAWLKNYGIEPGQISGATATHLQLIQAARKHLEILRHGRVIYDARANVVRVPTAVEMLRILQAERLMMKSPELYQAALEVIITTERA